MAGHPLRSATDRRLGGPLPRQLANQARIHLIPPEFFTLRHAAPCAYAVLAAISGCYPPVYGRLPTRYSPVRHSVMYFPSSKVSSIHASFDLHVLGTPPAFILSQDQTLNYKFVSPNAKRCLAFVLPFFYCLGSLFSEFFCSKFSGLHYCLVINVLFTFYFLLFLFLPLPYQQQL